MKSAVVAVLDHRGHQSALAAALATAFRRRRRPLALRTHRELVVEVDLEQGPGPASEVQPDRVLLWLSAADAVSDADPDERFIRAETAAASRSIAILTRSPVLNRPSALSATGSLPMSSARAARSARHPLTELAQVRPERFASALPETPPLADQEVHDYASGRNTYGGAQDQVGPFRFRSGPTHARSVRVCMVGGEVVGGLGVPAQVRKATSTLIRSFQLDLATVWWLLDGDTLLLSRIDTSAWDGALGQDLVPVAEALAGWAGPAHLSGEAGGDR